MDENKSTIQAIYKTSEVAHELGASAEWLKRGEKRGFFPPARHDRRTGRRFYIRRDIERLKAHRLKAATHG